MHENAAGVARGVNGARAASLTFAVDGDDELWVRRYRLTPDGAVTTSAFPMRGSVSLVRVGDDADVLLEHWEDVSGRRIDRWTWPPVGAPEIDPVELPREIILPAVQWHADQAAFAEGVGAALVIPNRRRFTIAWTDPTIAIVTSVQHIDSFGWTSHRRHVAPWRDAVALVTQREGDLHSEIWRVTPDDLVAIITLPEGVFHRDISSTVAGDLIVAGARAVEGSDEEDPAGGPRGMASTFGITLEPSGCAHGAGAPSFASEAMPYAAAALGIGGYAILGRRGTVGGDPELQLAILCPGID